MVVPQNTGSVRFNVDPFGLFSQAEITDAAKRCNFSVNLLEKESVDNLSTGERQLGVFKTRLAFREKTWRAMRARGG